MPAGAGQYYEDVAPSDWRPEPAESCTELHRRAYCSHADAAFPVLFVALVGLTCFLQLLSPGWLLLALPVTFLLGMQLLVVKGELLILVGSDHHCSSCGAGGPDLLGQ